MVRTYHNTSRTVSRIAIRRSSRAGLVSPSSSVATAEGMKSHLVCRLEIDTFDDIDFTLTRPVITLCPETWPNLPKKIKRWATVLEGELTEQP